MEKDKKIIYSFLGLPASGKGTQAELLATKKGIKEVVGIGALARALMKDESADPFILEIKKQYESGKPLSDEVSIDLMRQYLENSTSNIILDNFPFTLAQADFVEKFIDEHEDWSGPIVVYIKVSEEAAIKRATSRKVCPDCGAIYGVTDEMICEKCGGSLIVRSDDNVETVRKRLETYMPNINLMLRHYEEKRIPVIEINGEKTVPEVEAEIDSKI